MTQGIISAGARVRASGQGLVGRSDNSNQKPPHAYTRTRGHGTGNASTRARVHAHKIEGSHISIPTEELCSVWGALLDGRIRPVDVRTWLAAREVFERRKFAPRGCEARFKATELAALLGDTGTIKVRASLRRLERAKLVTWSAKGPAFIASVHELEHPDAAQEMLEAMPAKRRTFPMPRRMLRLLTGGVKRSVLATVLGHLLRCPHFSKDAGWDGAGACKASWVGETFGVSERSIARARRHLIENVRWLRPLESEQWRMNRYGGRFEVNLAWDPTTPTAVGEEPQLSTAQMSDPRAPNEPRLSDPREQQPSPTEISTSTPGSRAAGSPQPLGKRHEVLNSDQAGSKAVNLRRVTLEDLASVPRVMELFDQALSSPLWRSKGWTPKDGLPERLNWAATARRALVRGGTNPAGLFVHLVANAKWDHISNEDEDAVRSQLAAWREPPPVAGLGLLEGRPKKARVKLSKDGSTLRQLANAMALHRMACSPQTVDAELAKHGWSSERIEQARANFEGFKGADRQELELIS